MKKLIVVLTLLTPTLAVPVALTLPAHAEVSISALGDLTQFEKIASDTMALVEKNDMKAAEARITDFETAWDNAEPALYPKNHEQWRKIDKAADAAIASLRMRKPIQTDAETTVSRLVAVLKDLARQ